MREVREEQDDRRKEGKARGRETRGAERSKVKRVQKAVCDRDRWWLLDSECDTDGRVELSSPLLGTNSFHRSPALAYFSPLPWPSFSQKVLPLPQATPGLQGGLGPQLLPPPRSSSTDCPWRISSGPVCRWVQRQEELPVAHLLPSFVNETSPRPLE